jgi:hypothetical protein
MLNDDRSRAVPASAHHGATALARRRATMITIQYAQIATARRKRGVSPKQ